MLLSNPGKTFLACCFFSLVLVACSSSQVDQNRQVSTGIEVKREFPFSTKEPGTYQAELSVESGAFRDKWFVAKSGSRWRIDFFKGDELSLTQLSTDAVYLLDHRRRIYAANSGNVDPINILTDKFFKSKEHREFETIGSEGDISRYKVKGKAGSGDVIMSVNERTGVMMRQEFVGPEPDSTSFVYEVRELKFEVDEAMFQIPGGYRRISWAEFQSTRQQEK